MRRHLLSRSSVAGLIAAAFLAPAMAAAQGTASISGTVTDSASGRPIPSVQVVVVGTTRGAVSDDEGRFAVRGLAAGTWTVRAQRIGYRPATQTISLADGQSATASFTMTEVARVLSEVVSVGYGTDTRAEVSSAVTTVGGEQLIGTPTAGVEAALQGKAAGVQVTQNAGNPGNGMTVRIRGAASLTASNEPLYVIDGIPLIRESVSQLDVGGQDISGVTGLNPDEIEDITVLKDAAAAAIYGSRGSNGVVMVTTKRGSANRSRVDFDVYSGFQNVAKQWDMLNGPEYLEYMNEAALNDGYRVNYFGTPGVTDKVSTNWQDEIFRTAPVSNMNVSASGGFAKMQYYASGSYFDQKGVAIGSGYGRGSGRLNLDFAPTDRLNLKTSVGLTRESHQRFENDDTIEGVVANAIALQPLFPVYQPDGSFTVRRPNGPLAYANPVAIAALSSINTRTLRALGNLEAQYHLTSALELTGRFGADVLDGRDLRYESPAVGGTYASTVEGVARQAYVSATRYVLEGYGNYEVPYFGDHKVTLTAGSSAEWNGRESNYLRGEGLPSEAFHYPGAATNVTSYDGGWTGYNLTSFFGRTNYNYLGRYLATASVRTDGSSRFGENNRWGVFPAASLGWLISDEPMLGGMFGGNSLKLRGSFGETGNQAIPSDFASLERYGRASYTEQPGLGLVNLSNPDLRWETTRELDGGFDLGLFDSRITIIGDIYSKKTSDLLVNRPISSAQYGLTTILQNVGSMKNAGVEFQISTVNFRSPNNGFSWTSDFNVASNHNKVVSLYKDEPFSTGAYDINRVQIGHPIGEFFALNFIGVDSLTGDAKYEDLNKDGLITAADRKFVGSPHPKYEGGFRNTFGFRGFDIGTFMQFRTGNKIFNGIRVFADDAGCNRDNKFRDVLNRWTPTHTHTDQPRASWDCVSGATEISDRFIEDGSYLRFQEVTVGFGLPKRWAQFAGLGTARLYASGHNLLTLTDYSGYSPDVNSNGASANISLGTDFYAYPVARSFTFGVKGSW